MSFSRRIVPFGVFNDNLPLRASDLGALVNGFMFPMGPLTSVRVHPNAPFLDSFRNMGVTERIERVDEQVMRMKEDEENLEFFIDAKGFKPEEVKVSIDNENGIMKIEADHEEKSEDGNKYVKRHFVRQFRLPENCKPEKVVSKLSSNGLLMITAPKEQSEKPKDHANIPTIEMIPIQLK